MKTISCFTFVVSKRKWSFLDLGVKLESKKKQLLRKCKHKRIDKKRYKLVIT